jgi:hypothetical protein
MAATSKRSSSSRKGGAKTKNPRQYKALKRKGMPKARAAKIANAGKSASRKGGKRGGSRSRSSSKK